MNKPAKKTKIETTEPAVERDDAEEIEELDADELGTVLWGALGDDTPRPGGVF